MTSKWPRFPTDYLDSRRDAIFDQIHQYDLNVNQVHDWLLKRGPWISKDQFMEALRDWIDEEPLSWRPLPELNPTVDDLLKEFGNPYEDEREDHYDGRRGDNGSHVDYRRDDYRERKEGYGGMVDARQGQYERRDRYDDRRARNKDRGYRKDTSRAGHGYLDHYYDEKDHQTRSNKPVVVPSKPVPPRRSRPGLGQTMASKYVPGLHSQAKVAKEVSKHRTYNFFESFLKPDSPWTNPDAIVPIDAGPEAPPELSQTKPSRPLRPDMPEAYPVAEDPSQDLDAQFQVPDGGGIDDGGAYWERADPKEMEKRLVEDEQLIDRLELARQDKEYNDYDIQMFMQAVKLGSS